jgi:cytochrome c peroxidase
MCRFIALATTLSLVLIPALAFAADLTPLEALGKSLYFDKISSPSNMACADCHAPSVGFTGPNPAINEKTAVYPGAIKKRFGNRKPPTAAYATFAPVFHFDEGEGLFIGGNFWDGRATGEDLGNPAAEQALGPFLNPVEQNMPSMQAVLEVVAGSNYLELWTAVWGETVSWMTDEDIALNYDRIGLAIAAFEASDEVNSFSSKFDHFWANLQADGLDAADVVMVNWRDYQGYGLEKKELEGLALFNDEGKGMCSLCHVLDPVEVDGELKPPLFTDFSFDNLGTPRNPGNPFYDMDKVYLDDGSPINPLGDAWVDPGLGGFLMNHPNPDWQAMAAENMGKHKVPTLRNVAKAPSESVTKAYMHNGVFKSLREVVHFYNTRDVENWPAPEVAENVNTDELGNLGLNKKEEQLIVKFMETLSDGYGMFADGGVSQSNVSLAPEGPVAELNFSGPNPFNPVTELQFSLDTSMYVRVRVFDAAGRQVAVLHDGWTNAGNHRVPFQATGLASGIYYVQMNAGGRVSTAKAVLVK